MIRQAVAADAAAICAIWNRIIAETAITFTTIPKTVSEVEEMIASRGAAFLILENRKGFATYGPFRGGPGYAATVEHTILLAPEAQGKGAGRALMRALMDQAVRDEHHVMIAGISGANPAAMAFHSRLGFAQSAALPEVGRKDGTWLDLVLMHKILTPAS